MRGRHSTVRVVATARAMPRMHRDVARSDADVPSAYVAAPIRPAPVPRRTAHVLRSRQPTADRADRRRRARLAPLVLTAADGNRLAAFEARAAEPTGAGIADPARRPRPPPVLRGARPALRRARRRRARDRLLRPDGRDRSRARDDASTTCRTSTRRRGPGSSADIRAGADALRARPTAGRPGPCSRIGFCFGGRMSFLAATLGLGLAGVIGFYGSPAGAHYTGSPAPTDVADAMRGTRPRAVRRRRPGHPAGRRSRPSTARWRPPASTTGWSPTRARRTASSTARRTSSPRRAPRLGGDARVHPGARPRRGLIRSGATTRPPALRSSATDDPAGQVGVGGRGREGRLDLRRSRPPSRRRR